MSNDIRLRDVLEKMRTDGQWYTRIRDGQRPALWKFSTLRQRSVPATAEAVGVWLVSAYPDAKSVRRLSFAVDVLSAVQLGFGDFPTITAESEDLV